MKPLRMIFDAAVDSRSVITHTKTFGSFLLRTMLVLACCSRVEAAVVYSTDCSLASVQTACGLAHPGDTVQLPSGSAVWTSTLLLNKDVQLIGAGMGNTVIYNNVSGGNGVIIQWTTVPGNLCRLSGITFTPVTPNNGFSAASAITILGKCSTVRLDNCQFLNLNSWAVTFGGANFGVVDHCQFINHNSGNPGSGVMVYNGSIGGEIPNSAYGGYGDISWSSLDPVQWGQTNEFVYIESCTFDFIGVIGNGQAVNDTKWGSRMVFRYNQVTNGFFQTHATMGRERGARAFEYYGNVVVHTGAYTNNSSPFYLTSGSGVIYSNTLIGWAGLGGFLNYRASERGIWYAPSGYGTWGAANGRGVWDLNTNGLIYSGTHSGTNGSYFLQDDSANWTPGQLVGSFELLNVAQGGTNTGTYSLIISNTAKRIYYQLSDAQVPMKFNTGQSYAIYQTVRTLDQIGAGNGDLIADTGYGSGIPYNVTASIANNSGRQIQAWPNQPIDPLYFWANTINGNSADAPVNWSDLEINSASGTYTIGSYCDLKLGTDYVNGSRPNYTPLPFPHPLVSGTNSTVVITPNTYLLTVNGGTGGGNFFAGTSVAITAPVIVGQVFAGWGGDSNYLTDASSAITTVTMPANPVTITANYVAGSNTSNPGNDITNGLIAQWTLAGDVNDRLGNNNGTAYGSPGFVTGQGGAANSAVGLDGATQYVLTTPITGFGANCASGFTLTAWVQTTFNNGIQAVFGSQGGDGMAISLYLNYGNGAGPGLIEGFVRDGDGNFHTCDVTSNTGITDGNWHLLVWVDNPGANSGTIYVDGVALTTITPFNTATSVTDLINPMGLGIRSGVNDSFFNGALADCRIYNRTLSDAEVSTLFSNGAVTGNTTSVGAISPPSDLQALPPGN
jgi:Concanavalin A-like lectin/glucanases superfamily/Divergent InlB B-repeat domain